MTRGLYDFEHEKIKSIYSEICQKENLEILEIIFTNKLKKNILGQLIVDFQNGKLKKIIQIKDNLKIWKLIQIHEITHQYLSEKSNKLFHRHTVLFRKENLRLLKKYFFKY